MNKVTRIVGTASLVSALALGSSALAQTPSTAMAGQASAAVSAPMSVNIDHRGNAKIEGTITAVSSTSLTINSWGGVWNVDTAKAKLLRRFGGIAAAAELQAGDSVMVSGKAIASATAPWAITASRVQDMSIQVKNVGPVGVISNLNASAGTLTLTTANGKVYTVNLGASAKVRLNGKAKTSADLTNGMKATVHGVLDRTESTIGAMDISARVPKASASTNGSAQSSTGVTLPGASVNAGINANTNVNLSH